MTGQTRVRREFQADRGGKKAESEKCHVSVKGDRYPKPYHKSYGKIQNNRNGFIQNVS